MKPCSSIGGTLLATALLASPLPTISQTTARFALGVNLDALGAFVNVVNHTNRYSNATGYDAEGWPTSDFELVLMDGRPVAEWTGAIDDPEQYRVDYSGTYAARFTGQATIVAQGTAVSIRNQAYDPATNTTSFELAVGGSGMANHGLVILRFTNTKREQTSAAGTGIRRLVVNRPGYALGSNQVFTNEFLRLCKAADFACYRTYNLQNIWDGEPVYPAMRKWSDRKTPLHAAQVSMGNTTGNLDGWCWEYIVALMNELGKDVWINIHMSCDSAYVTELAKYLEQSLQPGLNIYVERSNEVWSPSQSRFGPYNAAQAAARGVTFDDNHAHGTVELSRWFANVFGAGSINKRIRVIMAGQQGYPGRTDNHLRYIQNKFGAPSEYIYATSSTVYFGSTSESSTDPAVIVDGMKSAISRQVSIPTEPGYRPVHIEKANTWNLVGGCTSYEGGPHMPAGGGTSNIGPQIRAHRLPAMADVLKQNYLDAWKDIGGGLAMYFTLASGYNRYGCWGLTDDYTKPDRNAKMQAMRDIIGSTSTSVQESLQPPTLKLGYDPASSSLSLRCDGYSGTDQSNVAVCDVQGRLITQFVMLPNTTAFLPGLPPVCYLFKANLASATATAAVLVP
jgi:hypothetical protein